jgi:hypothetical protein
MVGVILGVLDIDTLGVCDTPGVAVLDGVILGVILTDLVTDIDGVLVGVLLNDILGVTLGVLDIDTLGVRLGVAAGLFVGVGVISSQFVLYVVGYPISPNQASASLIVLNVE